MVSIPVSVITAAGVYCETNQGIAYSTGEHKKSDSEVGDDCQADTPESVRGPS